jgi:hypothetical protein
MIWTKHLWQVLLGALVARPAAALMGGNAFLYTNVITPGPNNVVGDFSKPTYAGYADQAYTITGPYTRGPTGLWLRTPGLVWQMGDDLLPTQIMGMGLLDAGGLLVAVGNLVPPVTLAVATDALVTACEFNIDSGQVVGAILIEP